MIPGTTMTNVRNGSWAYSEFSGKLSSNSVRPRSRKDFKNILLGKSSASDLFSIHLSFASFFNHVVSIIFWCPKEKMMRVAAQFNVAFVAYVKSLWNNPICEHPRNSMGAPVLVVPTGFTVSVLSDRTSPQPTLIWSCPGDIRPESFFKSCLAHLFPPNTDVHTKNHAHVN